MAPGKYSRVDGRKSSNYCSTAVLVAFVAFSLLAVWMFMSSSVVPPKYSNIPVEENNNEVVQQVSENELGRGDSNQDSSEKTVENQSDNSDEEGKEETVEKESSDKQDETKNAVEKIQEEHNDDKTETKNGEESNVDSDADNAKNTDDKIEKVSVHKDTQDNVEKNVDGGDNDGGDNNGGDNDKVDTSEQETDSVDSEKDGNKANSDVSEEGLEDKVEIKDKDKSSIEVLPAAGLSEILNETTTQTGAWSTQAAESQNEKKLQEKGYSWKVCKTTAGPDYIPCLDNWKVIRSLHDTSHYQHRERHCPDEAPTCVVPLPAGYKHSVQWPKSRDKIWFNNVPHTKLADVKGHQNWVKVSGEYLIFPGGGTQFVHGAFHYIELIEQGHPDIAWGKRSRVVLDVGCGVASFGGYLFEKDVLTMSLAPKDEHEAQVQFALERGIPAILAVMGTQRLPFPGGVFDIVHCARCRVPWHIEGGKLLLELNRALRPGGYFVWSATPVYRKNPEDSGIWKEMSKLTKAMCWDLVTIKKDPLNGVAAAIYKKPTSNECYEQRQQSEPPLCKDSDDKNAAWKVQMQACMHKIPTDSSERGSQWPEQWPARLATPPYWLNNKAGVYGKAAPEDFAADYKHWKNVISQSYLNGIGINWSSVRNVMDMRSVYGGFAAALKDLKLWVMNVVPIDSPDTLPIIFERGLFGMYHDWCESFNTYPRTYDLLHADHLFSLLKKRCNVVAVMAEVDRILRPNGKLVVRDDVETVNEIESMAKSLKWDVKLVYSQDKEGLLCVEKSEWRPTEEEAITAAII